MTPKRTSRRPKRTSRRAPMRVRHNRASSEVVRTALQSLREAESHLGDAESDLRAGKVLSALNNFIAANDWSCDLFDAAEQSAAVASEWSAVEAAKEKVFGRIAHALRKAGIR